jgi:hypothetical protein
VCWTHSGSVSNYEYESIITRAISINWR